MGVFRSVRRAMSPFPQWSVVLAVSSRISSDRGGDGGASRCPSSSDEAKAKGPDFPRIAFSPKEDAKFPPPNADSKLASAPSSDHVDIVAVFDTGVDVGAEGLQVSSSFRTADS